MSRSGRVASWRTRVANLGWIVLGIALYVVCVNIPGGYPRLHSEALVWVSVALVVGAGALVWYLHEHHDGQ